MKKQSKLKIGNNKSVLPSPNQRKAIKASVIIFIVLFMLIVSMPLITSCGNNKTNTTETSRDNSAYIASLESQIAQYRTAADNTRIATLESELDEIKRRIDNVPEETNIGTEDSTHGTDTTASTPSAVPFLYTLKNSEIVITEYTGNYTVVSVPEKINDIPVREISDYAFRKSAVVSVTVPEGVHRIGWFAFENCVSLTTVRLPKSLASIGYGAFDGCSKAVIYCPSDSYSYKYASSYAISVISSAD